MPTCGAVIQPIAVSVVSAASPLAAAAPAAMPPVTTSGRAGLALGPLGPLRPLRPLRPDPARGLAAGDRGSSGSRAGGASAETLTNPILATGLASPKQARRASRVRRQGSSGYHHSLRSHKPHWRTPARRTEDLDAGRCDAG